MAQKIKRGWRRDRRDHHDFELCVVSLGAALGGLCFLTAIFAKIGLEGVGFRLRYFDPARSLFYAPLSGSCITPGNGAIHWRCGRRLRLFLTLSGLATGASWLCYFRALKIGDAAKVAPVDKLSVVLVALFAVIFLGERPALKDWLGIFLVASGVVLLALKR